VEELAKAERQAARIETQNFDLSSSEAVLMVNKAATTLLTAIVEFLDASLSYFAGNVVSICPPCSI
jgi:hypothetical protein